MAKNLDLDEIRRLLKEASKDDLAVRDDIAFTKVCNLDVVRSLVDRVEKTERERDEALEQLEAGYRQSIRDSVYLEKE